MSASSSSVSFATASTPSTSATTLNESASILKNTSGSHHAIRLGHNDYPKVKEKDALCRTMGALFLQHRVDKLQSDVDKLGKKECSWKTGWKSSCSKQKESQSQSTLHSTTLGADITRGKPHAAPTISHEQARRIIIVDVSILIYSLRTIHNWLKEGDCRIIVPCEALRALDLLKKGEHYLNLAARKATRFLDERFVIASFGGVADDDKEEILPGLYPQKDSERITCAEYCKVEAIMSELGYKWPSRDEIDQLPHTIRETLACTLHFMREYTLSSVDSSNAASSPSSTSSSSPPIISLGLALPPPHFDTSEDLLGFNVKSIKYAQRADGSALLHLARLLGLGDASSIIGDRLIVAPTASSWLTADASGKDIRKLRDGLCGDVNG